jgi:flagellin
MRELAVQAVNDTNTQRDREYLQGEVSALIAEIDRVATQTQYNGQAILGGSMSGKIQVGTEANQTVEFDIKSIKTDNLGAVSDTSGTSSQGSGAYGRIDNSWRDVGWIYENSGSPMPQVGDTTVVVGKDSYQYYWDNLDSPQDAIGNLIGFGVPQTSINQDGTWNAYDDPWANAVQYAEIIGISENPGGGYIAELASPVTQSMLDAGVAWSPGSINIPITMIAPYEGEGTPAPVDLYPELLPIANSSQSGQTLADIDLSDSENASSALATISAAIEQVAGDRAEYGALQNRLEYTVSNLMNVSEFTTAARSRIADADFAAESARLAKAQVLQQSGTAMLAQANASSQLALSLIR